MLRLTKYYLKKFTDEEEKPGKNIDDIFANTVIMALVWSIGTALEEVSRPKFH